MAPDEVDPKKIEWRTDENFAQTTGAALEELTTQKRKHLRSTRAVSKNDWALAADDAYHERASNPKVAHHDRPMRTMVACSDLFNKVEPNEGEYMAGWRRDALTVPDRSIAALRHPKWLAGRAFPDFFAAPSLELMGPQHPVKDQIKKHVAYHRNEVLTKGPIVGPKSAKERLELKAQDAKKYGAPLPNFKTADSVLRLFNPVVLNKNVYLTEKEQMLKLRPARCDPKLPQMYTKGLGGLFDDDLKLLSASGMAAKK